MAVTGLDFVALQVRDIEQSATFYEKQLGLTRAPFAPPVAVVFTTTPITFAVHEPLPGIDLDEVHQPGIGVALWLYCDVDTLHASLIAAGIKVVRAPEPGPFGMAFTFLDPEGYAITVHEKA